MTLIASIAQQKHLSLLHSNLTIPKRSLRVWYSTVNTPSTENTHPHINTQAQCLLHPQWTEQIQSALLIAIMSPYVLFDGAETTRHYLIRFEECARIECGYLIWSNGWPLLPEDRDCENFVINFVNCASDF